MRRESSSAASTRPMAASHRHSAPAISPLSSSSMNNTNNYYQQRHNSVSSSANNPIYHQENHRTTSPWMIHQNTTSSSSSSSSNHQTSYYSRFDNSSSRGSGMFTFTNVNKITLLKFLPCVMLMVIPWIPCQQSKWQIGARRSEIDTLIKEQKRLVKDLEATTDSLRQLRLETSQLAKDNEASFQLLHKNDNDNTKNNNGGGNNAISSPDLENEQYLEVEKAEEGFLTRIDELEKHIQEQSAKRVEKKYGSGPLRVKVTVEENPSPSTSWKRKTSFFVIQLAMLMEMPYSVNHFLKMVELQLWDGLSMIHGTGSDVILATPMTMEGHQWAGQRFVEANLTHMIFTEFSETYPPPHQHKYSVAFSGRPGGPDFYISLEDDLEFHEHESTFGSVIEGRDVLDRFFVQKGGDGDNGGLNSNYKNNNINRAQFMKIQSIEVI